MNWSASLFFFLLVMFIIYVFAMGDDKAWKQILTVRNYSPSMTANNAGTSAGSLLGNLGGATNATQNSGNFYDGFDNLSGLLF